MYQKIFINEKPMPHSHILNFININSTLVEFINDLNHLHPNIVLTGSWSIYLSNLITRPPGDIDLAFTDIPTESRISEICNFFNIDDKFAIKNFPESKIEEYKLANHIKCYSDKLNIYIDFFQSEIINKQYVKRVEIFGKDNPLRFSIATPEIAISYKYRYYLLTKNRKHLEDLKEIQRKMNLDENIFKHKEKTWLF